MRTKLTNLIVTLTAAAFLAVASSAHAAFVIEYDTEFSDASDPAGSPPWLTATFEDVAANEVKLTFAAVGLVGSEYVTAVRFNLDPALSVTDFAISIIADSQVGTFADPTLSVAEDGLNANGAGGFDFGFEFDNAPPANRFTDGESIAFKLTYTGSGTFNEDSFAFGNVSGGHTDILTGAHVQAIGTDDGSGWVTGDGDDDDDDDDDEIPTVPAPAAFPAGLALLGLATLRRRRAA